MDVDSELLLSVASFSPPSSSFASFFSASACPASTLAGYIFLQHAASLRRADLCNGAAPASCQLLASQRDGGKQMVWWRKPGRSWEGEYKEAECRKTAWLFFFFFFELCFWSAAVHHHHRHSWQQQQQCSCSLEHCLASWLLLRGRSDHQKEEEERFYQL